ncbi:MAG: hypothetical protein LC749_05790 [Actinobacteria bacterium]|nr:hypothetical protein [Actinomycetota bacterium]
MVRPDQVSLGCWSRRAGGISQARKRLGPKVLAEVFEQVAGPVAEPSTRGAWLRGWRVLAIDGFEVDLPDTKANAREFGYAGLGANRSAFPPSRPTHDQDPHHQSPSSMINLG